jgi:hypothetical protein
MDNGRNTSKGKLDTLTGAKEKKKKETRHEFHQIFSNSTAQSLVENKMCGRVPTGQQAVQLNRPTSTCHGIHSHQYSNSIFTLNPHV